MNTCPLVQVVFRFLRDKIANNKPVLLALSGGSDSLALFYLLLECRKEIPFSLGIAHVDHGWREESVSEAHAIATLAKEHAVPFHIKELSPQEGGNLEAICRKERLLFFAELSKQYGYQATLLGHHIDDQAESIFKKLMEGGGLLHAKGMEEEVEVQGVRLWRPLLKVSKKTLKAWLDERGVLYFLDRTNSDSRFLRGRLRTEIFPEIERLFQKEAAKNLVELGREAEELKAFFRAHLAGHLSKVVEGPFGKFLSLAEGPTLSLFEAKELIRQFFGTVSREILEGAAHHLLLGSSNKRFIMGERMLVVDRGFLFAIFKNWSFSNQWKIEIKEIEKEDKEENKGWKTIWKGKTHAILPRSSIPYRLGPPCLSSLYPGSNSLRKWWNRYQVPAFLRANFPVVYLNDQIVYEFLTGQEKRKRGQEEEKIRVEIIMGC